MIDQRQSVEGWGKGIVPRLAVDIKNEFTEIKGFSERNLNRMLAFYREYKGLAILPTLLARLDNIPENKLLATSWANHVILIEKVKDQNIRFWYIRQIIEQGWTYNHLISAIKSDAYNRQGKAVTNFADKLPAAQSVIATEMLKDPYIFIS